MSAGSIHLSLVKIATISAGCQVVRRCGAVYMQVFRGAEAIRMNDQLTDGTGGRIVTFGQ
jgi:hypothetical protein